MTIETPSIDRNKARTALIVSTVAFTMCFACWVFNGVLVAHLVSTNVISFTNTEVSWLLATPILTGAISRVPLGMLTDRYGGRIVFFALMLVTAAPLYMVSHAEEFSEFLWASLGFGLAGGGFAVGVAYVASWFEKENQGTALGIFGAGNAGAAITTLVAPTALLWLTDAGTDPEGWRALPRIYAGILVVTALLFVVLGRERSAAPPRRQSFQERIGPLFSLRVWRFGLYYFFVFGSFVSIAQWLVPYSISVYQISLVQAGLLATVFSLPSGVIRAVGGWLSDRFGARMVMYWVFMSCAITCAILSVPRMDVFSPGPGVLASRAGTVTAVTPTLITVDGIDHRIRAPITDTPAMLDTGDAILPRVTKWHDPLVKVGDSVVKRELLAKGIANIYYPANLWIFVFLVFVFGVVTGIGKAGVFKFIPDYFPDNVGAVGGMVGLIGAMGGFVLPPLFGLLLDLTGVWSSTWIILAVISIACLIWMQRIVRGILVAEAPDLARLVEFSPRHALPAALADPRSDQDVESVLGHVPLFGNLPPEELVRLAEIGRYISIDADQAVFLENDPGDTAYVILKGEVDIRRAGTDGAADVVIATLGTGEVFGELALIDGQPRSASAVAVQNCELFIIERDDFIQVLSGTPRMLGDFMVNLSTRLRETNAAFYEATIKQERLQSAGELERHRQISQMVAGVAHEINTPIGIANHAASIIVEDLRPETLDALAKDDQAKLALGDLAEAAKLIENNIARADTLIRSFKNLSVHQASDQRENIALAPLNEEVIGLYEIKAKSSGITLNFDNQLADGASWDGFPGLYSQVMLNLLANAAIYAYGPGNEGSIDVVLAEIGSERYRVSVTDHGGGMDDEVLARVWEPFFTTGRDVGGSGLGLAVVRNIVTGSFGGTIDIESEPGKGTSVRFEFPKSAPDSV
jgi:MFS transporter, NNP family, nitrate/nitrite transporter